MFGSLGRFTHSIQGRLTSLVAVIVTGAVISTAALSLFSTAWRVQYYLESNAQKDAEIVASLALPQFEKADKSEFWAQLNTVIDKSGFDRFDIVDLVHNNTYFGLSKGTVAAGTAHDSLMLQAIHERRRIIENIDGQFRLILPVPTTGEPKAVIDVVAGTSVPTRTLVDMLGFAFATAIVLIALFVPVGFMIAQGIAAPLRRITKAARGVRAGNLNIEPLAENDGEIGELAATLNEMVAHLRDDTAEIRRLAFTDPVTGLANRERFRSLFERGFSDTTALDVKRGLFFIDLDHFKQVNDAYGHTQGDTVLSVVAERWLAVLSSYGFTIRDPVAPWIELPREIRLATVARHAGDEFTILIRNHRGPEELSTLAADLGAAARVKIVVDGGNVALGASIGVVDFKSDAGNPTDIMRFADLAMYEAKAAGRNSHIFFTPEIDQRSRDRRILEMELRKAVGMREFCVHYMVKVPLAGGECHGVEALVRWNHPRRGLLAPAEFIGLAETCGLIAAIDRQVLEEACRQAADWAARGWPMTVAVNLSASEFQRPDFVDSVLAILERYDLDPALLEIELTESMAMANPVKVAAIVTQLRAIGIRFAIDDFGTGYSNLGHLTTLSFDVLKIDQSFVRALGDRLDATVIIETILSLAQNLGVETVAEGIETAEQAAYLESHGCTMGQGYFFGKPVPPHELEAKLMPPMERVYVV